MRSFKTFAVDHGLIGVVAYSGLLYFLEDTGTAPGWLCVSVNLSPTGDVGVTTAQVFLGAGGLGSKIYVGASNGRVYQIDRFSFAIEAAPYVDVGDSAVCCEGALVTDTDPNGLPRYDLVFGSTSGALVKFNVPWGRAAPGG